VCRTVIARSVSWRVENATFRAGEAKTPSTQDTTLVSVRQEEPGGLPSANSGLLGNAPRVSTLRGVGSRGSDQILDLGQLGWPDPRNLEQILRALEWPFVFAVFDDRLSQTRSYARQSLQFRSAGCVDIEE
jgi:hypothetical protein